MKYNLQLQRLRLLLALEVYRLTLEVSNEENLAVWQISNITIDDSKARHQPQKNLKPGSLLIPICYWLFQLEDEPNHYMKHFFLLFHQFHLYSVKLVLKKPELTPGKCGLEDDYFPQKFPKVTFQGRAVRLREGMYVFTYKIKFI